jgi:hypothetical protein
MEDFRHTPTLPPVKDEPLDRAMAAAAYNAILVSRPDFAGTDVMQLLAAAQAETNPEKWRIANRLKGFNPKDAGVWREISRRFGTNVKQPELVSIATVLAQNANIKLDRDAKRRKAVLIKWFEENWTAIAPFLDYVVLEGVRKTCAHACE